MKYLLFLLPIILFASQKDCERQVYNLSKKYTRYPSTIVAIAYTESSCGLHILGDDGRSLGLMQIQVPTARYLAKRDARIAYLGKMSYKQLETLLLTSIPVQIQVASLLFEHHRKKHGYFGAISRYNGGANNHKYYNKVQRMKKWYLKRRYYEQRRLLR